MMKGRPILFLLALALLLSPLQAVRADEIPDIYQLIEKAPSQADHPEARAAILYQRTVFKVDEEWRVAREEHLLVKLFNKQGQNQFGDMKRWFDSETQSYEVVRAVTILPDWTEIDVEEKAINEVTPLALTNASIYANILEKVVSFPGLRDDAVIYLHLKRHIVEPEEDDVNEDEREKRPGFWTWTLFRGGEPILYKEFTIEVPEGRKLYYETVNGGPEPTITKSQGHDVYTWKVENAEMIVPEPNMPPYMNIAPRVQISSVEKWSDLGEWCMNLYEKELEASGEVADKVREITSGLEGEEDIIREIYLFNVGEIRSVNLYLGIAGYGPHSPGTVLENRYGDPRDKALLLTAMLREAGIEAHPAFVKTDQGDFIEEIPGLDQFGAVFVVAEAGGEKIWLDPFAEYCSYGYFPRGHGSDALVLEEGGRFAKTPDFEPEDNLSLRRLEITVTDDGTMSGTASCRLAGAFDARARGSLKYATPEQKQQFFEGSANSIAQGTLETDRETSDLTNLTEPVEVAQSFEADEYAVIQGDMMIFRLPSFPFGFAMQGFYPSLTERDLPFMISNRMKNVYRGEVDVPEGYRIAYIPRAFEEKNRFGRWKFECSYDEKAHRVTFESVMILEEREVSAEDYAEFKSTIDAFSSPKNRLVLLEKI